MKHVVVFMMFISVMLVGCASSQPTVKKVADEVYEGTQVVEKAVWDAM